MITITAQPSWNAKEENIIACVPALENMQTNNAKTEGMNEKSGKRYLQTLQKIVG
jgi:hypothetical protein